MATVAQKLASTLKEMGVRYVFGVPSGNWIDYMAAIEKTQGLNFILVTSESSCGFMADVCWRLTGRVAACFGTFGPGACNLSTGVCGGFLDRAPMLAFTDEMSAAMRPRITQMNIDNQALFRPITKWTTRISPETVQQTLYQAMHVATAEVPGPVHVGLPADGMALADATESNVPRPAADRLPVPDEALIEKAIGLFKTARRPLLAVGLTATRMDAGTWIRKIVDKHRLPLVLTPMAKGMLPEDHPCYTGVLAHACSDVVARTHQQADLVIGIGFDPVELNYEDWMPDAPLIHLDTRKADLDGSTHTLACELVGDMNPTLQRLADLDPVENLWDLKALAERRREMFAELAPQKDSFGPKAVLDILRQALPEDGVMTCDVGAHLHLIGQQWRTPAPDLQLMTNGCSSMGFAIPAAIAAKLSRPDQQACAVVGDGGFLMTVGEVATAMRLHLHIVFILITDNHLSLIRIKQANKTYPYYETRLYGDWYASAKSFFGAPVLTASNAGEYRRALDEAFEASGPVIVEALVDPDEYDGLLLRGNR
ncbi:MAG: acetolactate synthase [Deltaproteobacteria bacterium SG8_13]|nr:MAG: acetolactate synthase [Deltaproteobacteria bacterium SG8_13]